MANHSKKFRRGDAGMALLVATVFIAIALLTVGALSARYLQQRVDADSYHNYNRDFDAVEADMARAKTRMENNAGDGTIGLTGWTPAFNDKKELVLPDFEATVSHPEALPADPGDDSGTAPQFLAYTLNWGNDGRDNNGKDGADDVGERNLYSVHVAAKYKNVVRRAEAVYRAVNVNVWENAVFAGAGASGDVINGNVDIHGSVHILGDNLLPGNPALSDSENLAVELGGTSLIGNNYKDIPDYFAARVPALPKEEIDGTKAETLEAKLRVKHGLVSMDGNSHIGEPYTMGSTAKQQMNGTYVTDGWAGNKSTPTADGRGLPSAVYSDNGFNNIYDLGDRVPFPFLNSPWHDPVTGATVVNPATGVNYTHEEYFSQVLLADPNNPGDGVYTGNISLDLGAKDSQGAVYWNATTNTYLTGTAAVSVVPGAADDYFKFIPSKQLLEFPQKTASNNAGQIRINGTLTFAGKGGADTLNYTGRCAFLVTGDVNINVRLLTCNNGAVGDYNQSFPSANCLGIMTKTNINLGAGNGASQLDIMGGFYAQEKIVSKKQTTVMGTFVSSYFDMGSQVPAIYQVPELAVNLPRGMIGDYPIMSFTREAWREMGLG